MKDDRKIIQLTDREHVLLRPNSYVGSVESREYEEWILNDDGTLKQKKVSYVSGLKKIIEEIIDNSLDEYTKTRGKYSNKISIKIEAGKVTITDNGRGLPLGKSEDGEVMGVKAFTSLRAGSNFSNDRLSIGTNGFGSVLTNIWSKNFNVVTCDGKNKLTLKCKNNMESKDYTLVSCSDEPGTKITFIPDYKRFGVEGISKDLESVIKTRLRILSWFYPKCTIKYNGEKMSIKSNQINTMFPSPAIQYSSDNIYILVYPSEEPEILAYVNGISLRRGGSHIDLISNIVVSDIREKLVKKYKTIKPADIRNRLGLVVFFKDFPNCQFDSQTKETLTNNEKDVKAFLQDLSITDKISNKILREKEFLNNITELFQAKEALKEKKELQKLTSTKKQVDSDKYYPPISGTGKKYLMLTEGQSAFGGISKILGRKGIGYYCLRGKVLSAQDMSLNKILENKEVSDIVNILGLDLTGQTSKMNYDYVICLSDADVDGTAICSLIINLFNRLNKKVVEDKKIGRLNTPLLIGMNGNTIKEYYYEFPDQNKLSKRLNYFYLKGLGSWNKEKLDQVIKLEGGFENMILKFEPDKTYTNNIIKWFGSDSTPRKEALNGKEFHIDKV